MHNTDKMKKTDLQEIVRQAIQEVINEETYAGIASIEDMKKSKKYGTLASDAKVAAEDELKRKGIVTLEEDELDEMANVSVRYELAPDAAAADFTGKKARIITAMQATEEPMSKTDVATALGYPKQNPINADFMALVADGVIIPSGEQRAPRLNRPSTAAPEAGEEVGDEDGIEGGVAGDMSDEEIEASFAKAMGSGEEEPEEGEIETADVSGDRISDEDYEAFMKYDDLKNRLEATKSNILKAKRNKGGTAGDIKDKPGTEVARLTDLKKTLETKIDAIVKTSPYLQKRIEKLTGKAYEPLEVEDETDELDEAYEIRKLQFYAGIIK